MSPAVRKLLAQAAIVSEASAPSYEPRTAHGHQESSPPSGGEQSTYELLRSFFYEQDGRERPLSEAQMASAIRRAERELESIRKSPDAPEALLTPAARVLSWQGVPADIAARSLQTTTKLVRQWRRECGLSEEWGWPPATMKQRPTSSE